MAYIIRSFSIEENDENKKLLKAFRGLAAKDGWSFSRITFEAIKEYTTRHDPGNPQLALIHWTGDAPMPQTLREKAKSKDDHGLASYQQSKERIAKLNSMTNEELLSRQSKLLNRDGSYLERIEINMVLLARRLGPLDKPMP